MIPLPFGVRVWLVTGHTDMRRGFPALVLLVQEMLKRDPFDGDLFIFRGRRGDLIKIIWHDGQGACFIHQALGKGPLYMALSYRERGDDQHRPNGLSHRRDRLANAAKNLAPRGRWISCGSLTQAAV